MRANQQQVLEWLALSEGGYVNHPDDPGGPTNRGVTQRTFDAWRRSIGQPTENVRNITAHEADRIFVKQYFEPVRFDDLPSGLDYAVADFSVNSGPARAVKELQRTLGVAADGIMGVQTMAAIRGADVVDLIERYCARRMAFLRRLKNWPSFKGGWTKRVEGRRAGVQADDIGVVDRATKLARGAPAPAPRPAGTPKTTDDEGRGIFRILLDLILRLFGRD
jgi:lysozyme family protein